MFWRDITLSVWRKKTTGLKTKKRLLPLVLAAALCSSPVWAEEATFTANFKDTDLKSFIETVGANLNKTIIMGPGVQGKVSIRTMTPLNERQYYQLFLNLLEAQGYAVVPMENDVLKVVKSSAAKVEPLPLVGEGSDNYAGDEMVTKVVPVRNVSVRELAPILRQMIDSAGSGNVVNYDPSNVIMLTGRASVVERLTEVIQRVDHAGNRTEEVIPLDNASASEIARVLESLTKNSGENQPATLKSQIVADERTNSVIVSGDPATRDKMRRLIRRLDSEMERSGNSQVFYLKYSKAEDLVDVLKQVSGTLTAAKEEAEGTVGSGREIVSIAASKHSNALIVTAPQDIMQSLQSVIEQLDIRRAQVHVEALIVEVAEGSNINFGVQWASKDAGLMQFANGTQIPIGTLGAAISQAKPQKGSTVISENGATTINPDTNGDLSTLAQLLSGFSGTAVIDEDRSVQTRLGREDSEYLARSVPFYAANQPLADISEMRVVQGMDAGLYQKLKPLVCALPMTRQQININTLDVTQSVILEALFDPWLSPVQARALLQQRPAKGWEDVDQFLAQPLLADVDERTKKQLKTVLSVDSNYFWLRSDITVNEIELTMNSLIVRMGPQHFSVLWHQTGESE
ncbi:type II secretion system minor pseudopilin GspK [Escherichia coli]|uniref:type II secretion system minor pseudopilin GspK n=1 Tax=Escherichia coli TaxID=562 RepID=UPI000BE39169|nr:type II secretion system minor pseudopilin GspK [Escherichia coli]HAV9452487.1 type II secretion system minor pseudopilin GspK [Escherichia coli]